MAGFRAVLRPGDAAEDVASARACGSCTACCTVLRVDELGKRGGEPCPHLRGPADGASGCGIHGERPSICRRYRCLWLQGGLEEEDRPDRLGAVLDLLTEAGVTHLAVRETVTGALADRPRLQAITERYRGFLPVRVTDGRDPMDPDSPVRVLLADGVERCIEGERVSVFRNGELVERGRLPLSQRIARRVLLRIAGWRLTWARRRFPVR